jgi:membrane-bound ClpP family serine protease
MVMLTFLAITFVGFLILVGGAIFGHDHDHEFHFDHDHSGHDAGGHDGQPTVSVFSLKVIGSFITAFGCTGAITSWIGYGVFASSMYGIAAGFVLGGIMYGIMNLLMSQQSDSLISTDQTIGKTGTVIVEIGVASLGSVDIMLSGQNRNYLARSVNNVSIPKGSEVVVVRTNGSEVVVEVVSK